MAFRPRLAVLTGNLQNKEKLNTVYQRLLSVHLNKPWR